jgi:hypothetical protein
MGNLNIYLVSNSKVELQSIYPYVWNARQLVKQGKSIKLQYLLLRDDNIQDDLKNYWVLTSDKIC